MSYPNWKIRLAQPADIPAIMELENIGFDPKDRWSKKLWEEELAADNRCVLVAFTDAVEAVASFQCGIDDAELMRIIVAADRRRRGIASSLIESGLDWAKKQKCTRMLLEVSQNNPAAIGVYCKLGFEKIAIRKNYYGNQTDAVIMAKDLGGENDRSTGNGD